VASEARDVRDDESLVAQLRRIRASDDILAAGDRGLTQNVVGDL
jgi:hypothetical protein